jgi:hypothetical protein
VTTNADLAKQVGRLVDLESVVVRSADLDATFDPVNLPDQLTLESEYRSTYSLDTFPDGRKRVNVIIEFKFQCSSPEAEDGEPGEPALTLTSTFLLVYALNADVDIEAECFTHFANLNGAYNAWPYWREFVQSATTRAGLPGVIVPLFRPPVREMRDEDLPATLCLGSEAKALTGP